MNNKKISILAGTVLLGTALVGGTLAWFSDTQQVTNTFTTGEIKHEIVETFDPNTATNLLPGDNVNKDVWVHNQGKSDALLRVKITPVWVDGNNVTEATAEEVELKFVADITSNWTKGSDGYYYFNKVLKGHIDHVSNDKTKPCFSNQLLDSVTLSGKVVDQSKFAGKKLDVIVKSESVQVNGDAYMETWNVQDDAIKQLLNGLVAGNN